MRVRDCVSPARAATLHSLYPSLSLPPECVCERDRKRERGGERERERVVKQLVAYKILADQTKYSRHCAFEIEAFFQTTITHKHHLLGQMIIHNVGTRACV